MYKDELLKEGKLIFPKLLDGCARSRINMLIFDVFRICQSRTNIIYQVCHKMAKINWLSVGSGSVAIGHKPGSRISFSGLKRAGTTMVLTLLLEHEGAIDIENHVKQLNIEWIWFPFSASNPPAGKRMNEVFKLFEYLEQSLNNGNKIYIHCPGGIHRTGMITYSFQRIPEPFLFNISFTRQVLFQNYFFRNTRNPEKSSDHNLCLSLNYSG